MLDFNYDISIFNLNVNYIINDNMMIIKKVGVYKCRIVGIIGINGFRFKCL